MVRFFLIFCLMQVSLLCAEPASNQPASSITITGDEMLYNTDKNVSEVTGNARAEKGVGPEKQILTADKFIVHFRDSNAEKSATSSGQDIETIDAKGNVVVVKEDLVMKADSGTYSSEMAKDPQKADQIDCKDNVSITKAGHLIQGDEGTVNLKTGIYTVKKLKRKRVKALIQQPAKKAKA